MSSAPNMVIAGGYGANHSALVRALLGSAGGRIADRDDAPGSIVVYRHADRSAARAFIPGFREPRVVSFADNPDEYPMPALLSVSARPPRRIEVDHPSEFLRHCALVDTPAVRPATRRYGEVIAHLAGDDGVLVFVAGDARPPTGPEFDLLSLVVRRAVPVVLVVAGRPDGGSRPDTGAPWFRLDDAADLAALRQTLVGLADAGPRRSAAEPPRRSVAEPPHQGRMRAASTPWRTMLDRAVGRHRLEVLRWLAAELAIIQERGQRQIADGPAGDDQAVREMPTELDRELHTLSVRLTAKLSMVCHRVADDVLRAACGRRPTAEQTRRLLAGLHRAEAVAPEEALLVTSTAGVSTLRGAGALAGLAMDAAAVVRPIGVALSAGCYLLWENYATVSRQEARVWLGRALDSIAASLLADVTVRCHEFHDLLARVVGEIPERPLVTR